MTTPLDARAFQTRLERLDSLLHEAERGDDPAALARTREIVQILLDLHGAGLERLLDHVADTGEAGRAALDACAADDLVSGLLLLHDLHPLGLEERLRQALEALRSTLHSHGSEVKLLGVRDGVVYLRLEGGGQCCSSSASSMQRTIEDAIFSKAPEVTAVEVEGLAEGAWVPENGHTRFALPMV